jgi:hypothetical protein
MFILLALAAEENDPDGYDPDTYVDWYGLTKLLMS